jgi:hypothetical protein
LESLGRLGEECHRVREEDRVGVLLDLAESAEESLRRRVLRRSSERHLVQVLWRRPKNCSGRPTTVSKIFGEKN